MTARIALTAVAAFVAGAFFAPIVCPFAAAVLLCCAFSAAFRSIL